MNYKEKLKDPRWQKKRLKIFKQANWKCAICADEKNTLHIHHLTYSKNPWETKNKDLMCICEDCHTLLSQDYPFTIEQLKEVRKGDLLCQLLHLLLNESFDNYLKDGIDTHNIFAQKMVDIFIRFRYKLWEDEGVKKDALD